MSPTNDTVHDMDKYRLNILDCQERFGFDDLRHKAKEGIHDFKRHLIFERPCGEGAVPPNLLDEYDNADENQKASIARRYAGNGYGVDAYIVQLRMQIAHGIKLKNGLHMRSREFIDFDRTAAGAIWTLAHHHFGQDPHSDLKIKGYILWLMHGQKDVDKIPDNTMEGLQGLAAKIAYPLMFERTETALIGPAALYGNGPSMEDITWKRVDLPLDRIPTTHKWNGSVGLEQRLNSMLTRNLARDFPELTNPPGTGAIVSNFNRPLLIPIWYECSRELTSPPTISDMRSFALRELVPIRGPDGTPIPSTRVYHYDLCAVVNLHTNDVRLYGPRTMHLTEHLPPGGQQRDLGGWNLGQRETKFLLWYRRIDGENYRPPYEGAPEFVSAREIEDRRRAPGAQPPLVIRPPTRPATEASSSVMS